ncbi:uracil-DNA glycosylase [Terribacillus sp. DMT04]|uniref:uracil-DNA glycosylase n=1 Tax=Terribacillus sp. DMT04 TaxID=2850441 RepID=UPI001C2C9C66|nr:uracil-DNA glycosylase [Terribacillus sp. DMT04]QXE02466.1 uracil-DNA glycosylase [Terribacillus sp. DMT04]
MLPEALVQLAKERMAPYPCEGFLPGRGPKHPVLFFVGEAPGETEIHTHVPFSGRAGKELDLFLERAGVKRDEIFISSSVRSRPYQYKTKQIRGETITKKYNRTPTKAEVLAHAPVLDYEIAQAEPEMLITLGRIGWERLTGSKEKITHVAGKIIEQPIQQLKSLEDNAFIFSEKMYRIFPTYHPASVFYNPGLRPVIEEHAYTIRELLNR